MGKKISGAKSKKQRNEYSTFRVACRFIPRVFRIMPLRMTLLALASIATLGIAAVGVIVNAQLFTAIENYDGNNYLASVLWLAVTLLLAFAAPFINSYVNSRFPDAVERCACKMMINILHKIRRLPPIEMEKPDTLDAINKAEQGVWGGVALVNVLMLIMCGYSPYFIIMAIYLFTLRPILAIMPVLVFIPVFMAQLYKLKQSKQLEDKSAPMRRRYEHYEKCMGAREFFKETRALGAFSFFRNRYRDTIKLLNREIWKKERKVALIQALFQVVAFIVYGAILALLVDSLLRGYIGAGIFAAVFISIEALFNMTSEMLIHNLGSALELAPMAANVLRLLDKEERKGTEIPNAKGDITLEAVHFTYPNSETESIKGVSFKIKAGETIAIVGMNGAGKSTLVKLITGLFTPTDGRVLIGGADTRSIAPDALFSRTSAVFQDYGRYKLTLERNVRIGDFSKKDVDYADNGLALSLAGGDVDLECGSYPMGLDTMLSKEFGGTDISGGQWQRIAIARGLYRTHDLIVLDEPTAAIDPMEETRVYRRFADIAKDKTAIIVTHRLGSCRIADRIIVMDNGVVAEMGTHEQLLKRRGLYARMWDAQAEWLA